MSESQAPSLLPVLALKNVVLYPKLVLPLSVGREASRAAVDVAIDRHEGEILLVAQRDPSMESPGASDLYEVGTRAKIRKVLRTSAQSMEIIVSGMERIAIVQLDTSATHLAAEYTPHPLPEEKTTEEEALRTALYELAGKAIEKINPQAAEQIAGLLASADDPAQVIALLATAFSLEVDKQQELLEASDLAEALRQAVKHISHEIQVLEMRQKIVNEAQSEISKEQREYVLRRQLKAIQNELGEDDPERAEVDELAERLEKADLPEDVRKEATRELNRFGRIPSQSPERNILRTWLDLVLELPWRVYTEDALEIARAREILNEDHYGLDDVKERILEHLGVLRRNPDAKAPILCFVGPPGVGKTSLGQSIARALGRKFERMSVGGLHDEAELRGHRRTYIGAMAGRLIQAMRRAGAANPVLMLDEVDKLGRDFRGDPAAALLEVLDPAQNSTFRDNYLDMPFDLSKVLFITTANSLDTLPQPLLDRLEVIRLAGYSEEEKVVIANRYLIPRQLKEAGLTEENVTFPDEGLRKLIASYTREAGLRNLERAIGRLARKAALKFAEGHQDLLEMNPERITDLLGPETFLPESAQKDLPAGVATGLAWTPSGGDVLYVEAILLPSGKGLTLTGQLGEVMQESAKAAQSYLWAHAEEYGLDAKAFSEMGVHIHVPAGAIPKDGPSAGITAAVALASLYSKKPARNDTAMTGEITLTGRVLPIGGVKEKVLAARRAGLTRVVMPKANAKDLRDLPEHVRKEMEFIFAERIDEVFAATIPDLLPEPAPAR
ncbi:MAG: endopeptidase La [Bryobacteraceae bacterium]|nr:endopeptidase La [Solibacteraceae bacterium]MCO5351413.1 endopeptidase La [Bryobacteraceae bacterium]